MVKKLPDSKFTWENGAERCRVFLWQNVDKPPFMVPVEGWEIVGYGRAPWPGSTDGFAVMFEKVAPAEEDTGSMFQKQHTLCLLGDRIWQHGREEWVPGLPGYERRMARAK